MTIAKIDPDSYSIPWSITYTIASSAHIIRCFRETLHPAYSHDAPDDIHGLCAALVSAEAPITPAAKDFEQLEQPGTPDSPSLQSEAEIQTRGSDRQVHLHGFAWRYDSDGSAHPRVAHDLPPCTYV